MNEDKQYSVESSIIPTITSDLAPVGQGLAELAVDGVLDEGLLRDIPVVGVLSGLYKAQRSVRDHIFLKKVLKFLGPLSEATIVERDTFVKETLNTNKKRDRFSETVVNILERCDSSEKAELYGRFFLSHIQGQIEYDNALKMCSMIDRSFLPDLRTLPRYVGTQVEDNLLTGELYKNGFLSFAGMDGGTFDDDQSGGAIYEINWYGEQVVHMLQLMESEVV